MKIHKAYLTIDDKIVLACGRYEGDHESDFFWKNVNCKDCLKVRSEVGKANIKEE